MASGDTPYVHMTNSDNNNASFSANNAVVFQCSKCSSIVGDSLSWVSATKSLRSISLSCATKNVSVANTLEVSQSGADKGSTYNNLSCEQCKTVIGKQYVASSSGLDSIRGAFTFTVDNLNSYELGTGELTSAASGISLPETIYKMQYVIHVLAERVKKVENRLSPGSPDNIDRPSNDGELELVSEVDGVSSSGNLRNFNMSNIERSATDQTNLQKNYPSEQNSDFNDHVSEISYAPSTVTENSNMLDSRNNSQSISAASQHQGKNQDYENEPKNSGSVTRRSSIRLSPVASPKFRTVHSVTARSQLRMPFSSGHDHRKNQEDNGFEEERSFHRNRSIEEQFQSPPSDTGPRVKRKRVG